MIFSYLPFLSTAFSIVSADINPNAVALSVPRRSAIGRALKRDYGPPASKAPTRRDVPMRRQHPSIRRNERNIDRKTHPKRMDAAAWRQHQNALKPIAPQQSAQTGPNRASARDARHDTWDAKARNGTLIHENLPFLTFNPRSISTARNPRTWSCTGAFVAAKQQGDTRRR